MTYFPYLLCIIQHFLLAGFLNPSFFCAHLEKNIKAGIAQAVANLQPYQNALPDLKYRAGKI